MAWNDNPIVDSNSKRSEKSDLAVRNILIQENSFMTRSELPDYGVDLVIELMDEDSQMTGFQFAIQIKSSNKLPTINEGLIISFPFVTSRLGYLCRRLPGLGIVVFYSEQNNCLYYEYVENLVETILNNNANDNWKEQNEVNIHIPIENVLNQNSSKLIYEKMSQRRNNHIAMWQSKGGFYNLPIIQNNQYGTTNDDTFLEDFEKYGGFILINSQAYDKIHLVLNQYSKGKILQTPNLLFYAAVAYCEMEDIVEAQYYLKKCQQNIEIFDNFQKELLEMLYPKIEFLAGTIGIEELIEKLEKIYPNLSDSNNKMNVKFNLLKLELIASTENRENLDKFLTEIQSYFKDIDVLEISNEGKYKYRLQICEAIANRVNYSFSIIYGKIRIKEQLNVHIPNEIYRQLFLLTRLSKIHDDIIDEILDYAISNDDDLLKAEAYLRKGSFFMQSQFNFIAYRIEQDKNGLAITYKTRYDELIETFNIFIKNPFYREAQLAVGTAIEIRELFTAIYPECYDKELIEALVNKLQDVEKAKDLPPFNLLVAKALKEINDKLDNSKQSDVKFLNDDEIFKCAKKVCDNYELDKERLPNIVQDIKNYRKFAMMNKNPNIELLQDIRHLDHPSTCYCEVPKYILKSKETGLQTNPSSDIDVLLGEFENLL